MAKVIRAYTLSPESIEHVVGYAIHYGISRSMAVDRIIKQHMTETTNLRNMLEGLSIALQMIEDEQIKVGGENVSEKET